MNLYWRYLMNNYLAFIILAFCFGLVFTGSAQEFSRAMPQIQGQELGYMNSYYPTYNSLAYWNYRMFRLRLLSKMQKNVSILISTWIPTLLGGKFKKPRNACGRSRTPAMPVGRTKNTAGEGKIVSEIAYTNSRNNIFPNHEVGLWDQIIQ